MTNIFTPEELEKLKEKPENSELHTTSHLKPKEDQEKK